jgi:hypothetical protein
VNGAPVPLTTAQLISQSAFRRKVFKATWQCVPAPQTSTRQWICTVNSLLAESRTVFV